MAEEVAETEAEVVEAETGAEAETEAEVEAEVLRKAHLVRLSLHFWVVPLEFRVCLGHLPVRQYAQRPRS
jgi:hypothetical protein